jgi:hydroxymethylglutaryl-CoA reductase (NADPH)
MVRCPLFIFHTAKEASIFAKWLPYHFKAIKKEAKQHSNHAQLAAIDPVISGKTVHIRFYYTTVDASDQNKSTSRT